MIIDSHCHLDFPEFREIIPLVINEAKSKGVEKMLTISTLFSNFSDIIKLIAPYPQIFCTLGLHPCNVHLERPFSCEELTALCSTPKVIGLGETGLDYYHSKDHISLQKESFSAHIQCAQQTGLPLIVHTRDAEADTLDFLTQHLREKEFKGVIHCFSGTIEFARACLDLGLYISFSGIVTFKNATEIQEVARLTPLDRMLVETDSPYLAPTPFRGKTNQPAYTYYVAEHIAKLKGLDISEVASHTTKNFHQLFTRA